MHCPVLCQGLSTSFQVTLHLKSGKSDSQRYPLNICLFKNEWNILIFSRENEGKCLKGTSVNQTCHSINGRSTWNYVYSLFKRYKTRSPLNFLFSVFPEYENNKNLWGFICVEVTLTRLVLSIFVKVVTRLRVIKLDPLIYLPFPPYTIYILRPYKNNAIQKNSKLSKR